MSLYPFQCRAEAEGQFCWQPAGIQLVLPVYHRLGVLATAPRPKNFPSRAYLFGRLLDVFLKLKGVLYCTNSEFEHWFFFIVLWSTRTKSVSYTHLTLPTNREV